jgi:hypothetical protein
LVIYFANELLNLYDRNFVETKTVRYAMDQLVKESFLFNPELSLNLFKWGFKNDLFFIEKTTSTIINELSSNINSSYHNIIEFMNNFIIPYFREPYPELIESILRNQFRIEGRESLLQTIKELIKSLEGSPNSYEWLKDLKLLPESLKINNHNIDFSHLEVTSRYTGSSEIYENSSAKKYDRFQIVNLLKIGTPLEQLLNEQAHNNFFDWKFIVDFILENPNILPYNLNDLTNLFNDFKIKTYCELKILEQLPNANQIEAFDKFSELIMKRNKFYDWFDYGNETYSIVKIMYNIDPEKTRKAFIDQFVKILTNDFYPQNTISKFDQILNIFEKEINFDKY